MSGPEHDPERTHWAPYMEWAQARPAARHDLAGSNLLHVGLDELEAPPLALHGANDGGYPPLLEALAAHYGVATDRIATGTGASGANFVALAALLAPGAEVLYESPGYDPIPGAARLLGAPVRRFERRAEEGWRLDAERIEAALGPATRVLALTNPHNPTGALASTGELDAIAALAERRGLWVLVDEVYLDTATFPGVFGTPPAPSLAELTVARRGAPFVATSSLTKSYGLSGLRCGWAVAPPPLAAAMRRARGVIDAVAPFATDLLAAHACRRLDRLARRAGGILRPNLAALARFVADRPALEWTPPRGGNVAFPRVAGVDDTGPLCRSLLEESGVAVVPGALFGAPRHLRISFGGLPPDRFTQALAALAEHLDGLLARA
jgi:aspartate/methionine/tyrosine aminotransferase